VVKKSQGGRVIKLRHQQPSLWHKELANDVEDLREPWIRESRLVAEDAARMKVVTELSTKLVVEFLDGSSYIHFGTSRVCYLALPSELNVFRGPS